MMDSFNRQVLRVAVAQICQSMGWDSLQKSTHDALTDVMQRYLEEIGKVAYGYTQLCNRTNPNLDDLDLAFQDTGVVIHELENYVAQVDPVQFIHHFTAYPRCKPCRLQHPSAGEIVDRAEFYSEHLPPLPKVCEEPKDESEENAANNAAAEDSEKILAAHVGQNAEKTEEMKTTNLKKESSDSFEVNDGVGIKRLRDGPMFLPDSKRSRLDIPSSLNIEKKENLENTDVDSMSPATPVSPYLPQEIPQIPEGPANSPAPVKVKTEPKKVSDAVKEMVLPLKKITPPDKKAKPKASPSRKKPKIKPEKSVSPKLPKTSLSPGVRSEPLISPKKPPGLKKKSPSPKLKSPKKAKSPAMEKPVLPLKKTSEQQKANGEKKGSPLVSSPHLTSPVKTPVKESALKETALKKSSPRVPVKKENQPASGKHREDKQPKKKKKRFLDETDSLNPPAHTGSPAESSTPKLMIKLLPKSDAKSDVSKSSPGETSKVRTPSVTPTKPSAPESKKKLKTKSKFPAREILAKPIEKIQVSSGLVECVTKKEHGKKKKKKKDKIKDKDKDKAKSIHREKHKTPKTDKTEPPIPKIRFKLDPSGESKVVETKAATPKTVKSSGQASSKKSSLVIETEKVNRSVITETLSNTLDYDPSKAYFCPVCKKQDDGSPMVGCDGCDEWCHWACVGLIAAPPEDEQWYCPQCLLMRETSKKSKSKKKQ